MSEQNSKVIESRLQQLSLMLDEERGRTHKLNQQLTLERERVADLEHQIDQVYNAKNSNALGLSLAQQELTDLKLKEGVNERTLNSMEAQLEEAEKSNALLQQRMDECEQEYKPQSCIPEGDTLREGEGIDPKGEVAS